MASIEELNSKLAKLEIRQEKKEEEQDDLNRRLKNAQSPDAESKIFDLLKTVNETVLSIQQERLSIVELMKLQVEKGSFTLVFVRSQFVLCGCFSQGEVVDSPRKKVRRSLPVPTSASKWNFLTLEAYAIHFVYIYELDQFLCQAAPIVSGQQF